MTVRVGILGTGWGVKIQVPAFRQAGLEIAGLWARSAEKAEQTASELSIAFNTQNYHSLLARDEIDLISVVTPPHTHAEISIAALESGKHVLCEKPTALNALEAGAMLAAAQAHPDLIALIDHETRFAPARQRMRELIRSGYVGEIYHVEWTLSGARSLNPKRPWNWWSAREQGGGLLGAVGSHAIDGLTWIVGRRAISVSGDLQTFIRERADASDAIRPVTSDDQAIVQLRFENGISGLINLTGVAAGPTVSRLRVLGSKASLIYENQTLTGYRADSATPDDLTLADHTALPASLADDEWSKSTIRLAQALKTAIETGDRDALTPAATFADGLYVQRVLDAVRESNEKGSWVELSVNE